MDRAHDGLDHPHPFSVGEAMNDMHTRPTLKPEKKKIKKNTPKDPPLVPVPSLVSSTKDGDQYKWPAHVQAAICEMSSLPRSRWVAQVKRLPSEALVFLIRQTHETDSAVCGGLLEGLRKRMNAQTRRLGRDLDEATLEDVSLNVEIKIFERVLKKDLTRQCDVLEVAFGQAVKRQAKDELDKINNSWIGNIVEIGKDLTDEDGDPVDRPMEFLLYDNEPGPEDILFGLENRKHRRQLFRIACKAVQDRRHLRAAILHYVQGVPIETNKRGKPSLCRRFRKERGEIKYWLDTAMQQMRTALGIQTRKKRSGSPGPASTA
jgi:hypothetical protein